MNERDKIAAARICALRGALGAARLDGFIVPKSDAFQNEYVPAHDDRLAWLTGFTGSAGIAVILKDKAALIVDSRYTLQAKDQVSSALYAIELVPKVTAASYLAANAAKGSVIGYDPALHTVAGFKQIREEALKAGVRLSPRSRNPIDRVWKGRPAEKHVPIYLHDDRLSGESAASKLDRVQKVIAEKTAAGLLVCAPDAVAWLFNIRGGDVLHTPIPLVRAFVPLAGKPMLFVSNGHINDENRAALAAVASIRELASIERSLRELIEPGTKVLTDPAQTTLKLASALRRSKAKIAEGPDPITLFKAKKNAAELEGARKAHLRDGAALCRFLAWLDAEAPGGKIDELIASDKLEDFRRQTGELQDLSFDTISGAGSNGAIVHYRATPETNKPLRPGTLYLSDSGAQYRDGTTDVTRTIAIGEPSVEMQRHFTLVLKGHIAISAARFPAGTRGVDIDGFARRALWSAGLDYGHGTGHGIGSFLSVHEGPQSISRNGMTVFEPGMILSNEPGYYREGHYGIRLENLIIVTEPEEVEGGELPLMGFETLTLAPFDRRLILPELLGAEERAWLNAYHATVWREISPELKGGERKWLRAATAPL
jgi:Xaa-Pro aminopeptidase